MLTWGWSCLLSIEWDYVSVPFEEIHIFCCDIVKILILLTTNFYTTPDFTWAIEIDISTRLNEQSINLKSLIISTQKYVICEDNMSIRDTRAKMIFIILIFITMKKYFHSNSPKERISMTSQKVWRGIIRRNLVFRAPFAFIDLSQKRIAKREKLIWVRFSALFHNSYLQNDPSAHWCSIDTAHSSRIAMLACNLKSRNHIFA